MIRGSGGEAIWVCLWYELTGRVSTLLNTWDLKGKIPLLYNDTAVFIEDLKANELELLHHLTDCRLVTIFSNSAYLYVIFQNSSVRI